MKSFLPLVFVTTMLGACASSPNSDALIERQRVELEAQKVELARCIERIEAAESRNVQLESEIRRAKSEILERDAQITELQTRLNAIEASPDSAEVAALRSQLRTAREDRLAAERRAEHLAAENAAALESIGTLRNQLSILENTLQQQSSASNPGAYMPDPRHGANDSLGFNWDDEVFGTADGWDNLNEAEQLEARLESGAFITKKVYYASTRTRLVRQWTDYLQPFYLPLALLLLFLLLRRANRRYIKEEYQVRAGLIVTIIALVPAVLTTLMAVRKVVGMYDNDQRLYVQYGNSVRNDEAAPYERGFVEVSIPKARKLGEVNLPELTKLELVVDRTKHFQLVSVQPVTESDDFYADMQQTISASTGKELFVFVHGFHNTFQDAAYRTAQIAHDINFEGAPIFFSWTSQGSLLDYMTDAENVKPTANHLRRFLEELHDESGAERIHLIAHSMGSRALTMALQDLQAPYRDADTINEVVFAAPDVRKSTFIDRIRQFPETIERVTLYASAYDSALQVSRAIQGGQDEEYQRAGETKPTPVVTERLQTIDVSFVTVGHSYISDSPYVLNDLRELLLNNRSLEPAGKTFIPTPDGGYWILQ